MGVLGSGGRNRKTVASLKASGTYRPDRHANRVLEDVPAPETLEPPTTLRGFGLEEWRRLIGVLVERGGLTMAELASFSDYCLALTQLRQVERRARKLWREATRAGADAGKEPSAFRAQELVMKLRDHTSRLRQTCGLTPATRGAVKGKAAKPLESDDPADRYLQALPGGRAS